MSKVHFSIAFINSLIFYFFFLVFTGWHVRAQPLRQSVGMHGCGGEGHDHQSTTLSNQLPYHPPPKVPRDAGGGQRELMQRRWQMI